MSRYTFLSRDETDPLQRLSIDDGPDDDDLITIADEEISSRSSIAAAVGIRGALDLTTEQALWLYDKLGKVLVGRGELPLPTLSLARGWLRDEAGMVGVDRQPATDDLKSLALLLQSQRSEGERAGIEQCPAKPADRRIVQAALDVLLSELPADATTNLTVPEFERAAELKFYLEAEDEALKKMQDEGDELTTADP